MGVKGGRRGESSEGEGHDFQIASAVRFKVSLPEERNACYRINVVELPLLLAPILL